VHLHSYLLINHVGDELDAGCAANLVVALEAALKVQDQTLQQQLTDVGKLEF
jgi:hypothetical protein